METHNLLCQKSSTKSHRIALKSLSNTPKCSWNLLTNVRKTAILTATRIENSNCYSYKYDKNHILLYYRWVIYGTSKSKNSVFDCLELFLIACFKTIILKTYFEENKVKAHVYEVPAFVASLTEPLSFCVSDHDGKIKENSHSL